MKVLHKGRNRHTRRVAVRKMLKGTADLKVLKGENGYRLASSNGVTVFFGPTFDKEGEAVSYGERRFGKKAKRMLRKVAA